MEEKNTEEKNTKGKKKTHQKTHLFRIKGSVLLNVLSSALFITAFSAVIVILYQMSPIHLAIPISLITVLGLVVGLLLTYRTNTAYDRYWEGRKLWSTMVTSIRNLTRCIWVHIDDDNDEKRAAINLLAAFPVAVKHELREENGCQYEDLIPVIPGNILPQLGDYVEDRDPIKIPKTKLTLWDQFMHKTYKPHLSHYKEETSKITDTNIPLEISLFISAYINYHYKAEGKKIDAPLFSNMLASVNVLVDCLSQFERVLRSPIPLAYSIHLAQTVWVYCLSLPFQLVGQANYATIPIVFFASMVLIGIERIGAEIENPFGYDENDLPLDEFCEHIKVELDKITSSPILYKPPDTDIEKGLSSK